MAPAAALSTHGIGSLLRSDDAGAIRTGRVRI
jgi:hypothetical protein